jgi:hypothetical protein
MMGYQICQLGFHIFVLVYWRLGCIYVAEFACLPYYEPIHNFCPLLLLNSHTTDLIRGLGLISFISFMMFHESFHHHIRRYTWR